MDKKNFAVLVREVWIQVYETEAVSEEEAIQNVKSGNVRASDGRIEYSHQLDSETWTAEEEIPTLLCS